jgi:hypothetical protein
VILDCTRLYLCYLRLWLLAVKARAQPRLRLRYDHGYAADKEKTYRYGLIMFEHAHDSASSAVPPPAKDHRVLHSMIHRVLPTVLSNRLPTLPSIRRSISDMRERSYAKKEPAEEETPGTPPPGYTSRPGSGSATPDMCGTRDGEMEGSRFPDHVSERLLSSPFATGEGTGVNWKYARQGEIHALCSCRDVELTDTRCKPHDAGVQRIQFASRRH